MFFHVIFLIVYFNRINLAGVRHVTYVRFIILYYVSNVPTLRSQLYDFRFPPIVMTWRYTAGHLAPRPYPGGSTGGSGKISGYGLAKLDRADEPLGQWRFLTLLYCGRKLTPSPRQPIISSEDHLVVKRASRWPERLASVTGQWPFSSCLRGPSPFYRRRRRQTTASTILSCQEKKTSSYWCYHCVINKRNIVFVLFFLNIVENTKYPWLLPPCLSSLIISTIYRGQIKIIQLDSLNIIIIG